MDGDDDGEVMYSPALRSKTNTGFDIKQMRTGEVGYEMDSAIDSEIVAFSEYGRQLSRSVAARHKGVHARGFHHHYTCRNTAGVGES